jgi:MICOS complex subunit MIC12
MGFVTGFVGLVHPSRWYQILILTMA